MDDTTELPGKSDPHSEHLSRDDVHEDDPGERLRVGTLCEKASSSRERQDGESLKEAREKPEGDMESEEAPGMTGRGSSNHDYDNHAGQVKEYLGEQNNNNNNNNNNGNIKNTTTTNNGARPNQKVCGVCGENARSMHFGGVCCDPCKAFFRRSVQSNMWKQYFCLSEENCNIYMATRKSCQFCRFAKCRKIGMEVSWVMGEKDRRALMERRLEKRRLRLKRRRSSAQARLDENACLSSQDKDILRTLKTSLKSMLKDPGVLEPCHNVTEQIIFIFLQRLGKLFYKIPEFQDLSIRDQELLLKNGVATAMFLYGAHQYDVETQSWPKRLHRSSCSFPSISLPDMKTFLHDEEMYEKTDAFLAKSHFYLKNEVVTLILMIITLFNPDTRMLDSTEKVESAQGRFLNILHRYLEGNQPNKHEQMEAKLLLLLADVRELTDHFLLKDTHELDETKQEKEDTTATFRSANSLLPPKKAFQQRTKESALREKDRNDKFFSNEKVGFFHETSPKPSHAINSVQARLREGITASGSTKNDANIHSDNDDCRVPREVPWEGTGIQPGVVVPSPPTVPQPTSTLLSQTTTSGMSPAGSYSELKISKYLSGFLHDFGSICLPSTPWLKDLQVTNRRNEGGHELGESNDNSKMDLDEPTAYFVVKKEEDEDEMREFKEECIDEDMGKDFSTHLHPTPNADAFQDPKVKVEQNDNLFDQRSISAGFSLPLAFAPDKVPEGGESIQTFLDTMQRSSESWGRPLHTQMNYKSVELEEVRDHCGSPMNRPMGYFDANLEGPKQYCNTSFERQGECFDSSLEARKEFFEQLPEEPRGYLIPSPELQETYLNHASQGTRQWFHTTSEGDREHCYSATERCKSKRCSPSLQGKRECCNLDSEGRGENCGLISESWRGYYGITCAGRKEHCSPTLERHKEHCRITSSEQCSLGEYRHEQTWEGQRERCSQMLEGHGGHPSLALKRRIEYHSPALDCCRRQNSPSVQCSDQLSRIREKRIPNLEPFSHQRALTRYHPKLQNSERVNRESVHGKPNNTQYFPLHAHRNECIKSTTPNHDVVNGVHRPSFVVEGSLNATPKSMVNRCSPQQLGGETHTCSEFSRETIRSECEPQLSRRSKNPYTKNQASPLSGTSAYEVPYRVSNDYIAIKGNGSSSRKEADEMHYIHHLDAVHRFQNDLSEYDDLETENVNKLSVVGRLTGEERLAQAAEKRLVQAAKGLIPPDVVEQIIQRLKRTDYSKEFI